MNEAQAQALRWTLLTGLASGLGAGGLAALANMSQSKKNMEDLATTAPQLVNIPHPQKAKKPALDHTLEDDETEKMAEEKSWTGYIMGRDANNALQVPIFPLAAAAAGIGIGGLGYSLVDSILKNRRKKEMEQEVADAEEEFNQTLMGAYDPKKLGLTKASMALEISSGLEKLANLLKVADKPSMSGALNGEAAAPSWANTLSNLSDKARRGLLGLFGATPEDVNAASGYLTGPLLLAAAGVPAASAYLAYNYYKGRDKSKLLNEAAKARQAARLNENIPEPYVQVES